jgi:hypothetical protein
VPDASEEAIFVLSLIELHVDWALANDDFINHIKLSDEHFEAVKTYAGVSDTQTAVMRLCQIPVDLSHGSWVIYQKAGIKPLIWPEPAQ